MPINRPATKQRNVDADERRIRGTGLATGARGQAFQFEQTTRLTEYLTKVLAKHPTARKREIEGLTPEVFEALQGIPKATIAAAMLRGVINCRSIVGQKVVAKILVRMGDELQTEARGMFVRKALGPKEFERLKEALAHKASMRKKLRVEGAVLRAHEIHFEPWNRILREHVGAFACDSLLRALPDVIELDKYKLARVAEQAWRAIDVNLYANPVYEPSVEPPFQWFGFDGIDGDTFVHNCRDVEAVRAALARNIPHLTAVNSLQATRFRINDHALEVVKAMRGGAYVGAGRYPTNTDSDALEEFHCVGSCVKFLRLRPDLLKKVRDDGAEALLEQNIKMADDFAGRRLHIPLRIDFRGRLITGPNLNFATADHIRGLFKFDETAPLTDRALYWLKVACATSYDALPEDESKIRGKRVSKLTFAARLAWTDANLDRICEAGRRPLDNLEWLNEAADPIQCVALFHELANAMDAIDEGLSYRCSVPIGFDASCSALQHFALLARDVSAARLTNLVPTEDEEREPESVVLVRRGREGVERRAAPTTRVVRVFTAPQDIYAFIQHHVQMALASDAKDGNELAVWWLGEPIKPWPEPTKPGHMDRKILKALVMTYGYSAKEWGQKSGVYKELRRRRVNIPNNDVVPYLVKKVRKAIETLIPAAKKVMDDLQALVPKYTVINLETGKVVGTGYKQWRAAVEAARTLTDSTGKNHQPRRPTDCVRWISPSGLPVANSYPKPKTARVRNYILGHSLRPTTSVGWKSEQRIDKATSSIAPNYIHSLDASHLALVANACARENIALVTVHDSYATLPAHADRLRAILLEQMREMYRTYETLVQPTGDLNIDEVIGEYAFS